MGFSIEAMTGMRAELMKLAEQHPNPLPKHGKHRQRKRGTRGERVCHGKFPHPSLGHAEAAIRSLVKRGLVKAGEMHPYKCPRCFKIHTGRVQPHAHQG